MAWPEEIDQSVGSTWYLEWQSMADISFRSRKLGTLRWYFLFIVKSVIYGYVLYHTFRFMRRKIPGLLGYGPYRRDPNFRKLRKLVCLQLHLCYDVSPGQRLEMLVPSYQ